MFCFPTTLADHLHQLSNLPLSTYPAQPPLSKLPTYHSMTTAMGSLFYYNQLEDLASSQQDSLSTSPSQPSLTTSEDEVVSVPDQNCREVINQDHPFLKYAVKLGYELALAQDALSRLGGAATTNSLLAAVLYSYATLNPSRRSKHHKRYTSTRNFTSSSYQASKLGNNLLGTVSNHGNGYQGNGNHGNGNNCNGNHGNGHQGNGYQGNDTHSNGYHSTQQPHYNAEINHVTQLPQNQPFNNHQLDLATLQQDLASGTFQPTPVSTLPQQRKAITPPSSTSASKQGSPTAPSQAGLNSPSNYLSNLDLNVDAQSFDFPTGSWATSYTSRYTN